MNDQEGKLEGVFGTHMLLSTIDEYLNKSARNHNGYAFLFDKNTGEEISSSDDISFQTSQVYEQYMTEQNPSFLYKGDRESLYILAKEHSMGSLDWIVLTAIPKAKELIFN